MDKSQKFLKSQISELDIGGRGTCLKKLFLCENLRISFQLKTKLEVWMQTQKKIVRKRTFSRSREDRERRRLQRRTKIKSRGRRILEISFFKNQRPSQEEIAELAADAKLERCIEILKYRNNFFIYPGMLLEFGFLTEDKRRRNITAVLDPEATLMTTVMTRVMRRMRIFISSPTFLPWKETRPSRGPPSSSGIMSPLRTWILSHRLWNKLLELGIAMMKDTLIF